MSCYISETVDITLKSHLLDNAILLLDKLNFQRYVQAQFKTLYDSMICATDLDPKTHCEK